MWTEVSFSAKSQTTKTASMVKYFIQLVNEITNRGTWTYFMQIFGLLGENQRLFSESGTHFANIAI